MLLEQAYGKNWHYVCFARGYGETDDVFHKDRSLVERNNAFSEWRTIALQNDWLMQEQRELAAVLEEEDRKEKLEEEGIY